ncbi:MAG: YchF/TatD family DNA exonuclease [Nitrospirae bacterium]|nr:MAG: YchF/TatD family DNA exonuclease [Nitrospirota bacterium]
MIDTHCHLEMSQFEADRAAVIKNAFDSGLEAVITIGSDFKGCEGAFSLAGDHADIYAAVGLHPHDAKDFNDSVLSKFKSWVQSKKVVAIGEIGLDYHYDHSPRQIQQEVFAKQLAYANECGLPVIIHSREAKADTMKLLEESGVRNGVLHCFSGDMDMAEKAMALGFHISIAGPVTFKKAQTLREVAAAVPDDYLLIETDAPYLAPEPLRGKRNEPAFIVHTARFIAQLRGVTFEDIDRITTINTKRLFGIGVVPSQGEIAYKIRNSLYLNVTNRCTSRCTFCVKFQGDFVKGHNLRLQAEPSEEELKSAIGDPLVYDEVVFCGYGEPLLRPDTVKAVAAWVKEKGGKVRINTNGHGNLVHKKNILPEFKGIVDSISVSLDAHDAETYDKLCNPAFKNAFPEVIDFIREAKKFIPDVQATIVTAEGVDVGKCREITDSLGVKLRIRELDIVG